MRVAGRSIRAVLLALLLVGIVPQLTAASMIAGSPAHAGGHTITAAPEHLMTRKAGGLALEGSRAQVGGIQMHADAGFAGDYRANAWVPIRVRISNSGPQFTGVLQIEDSGQQATFGTVPTNRIEYTRNVLIPQSGVKLFTLYVPGADLGSSVTVRLVGNEPTLPQTVPINSLNLGTIFAGVLSRNANAINQLRAGVVADASIVPVKLDAATFDTNPLALASFDLMVISDFNSCDLSSDQQAALEAWVREGGTLVEIGGPAAQTTVSCLPAALQIVHPGQPLTLSHLPGLAAAGGSAIPAGQYVAATGQITGGTVVLDQQQMRTATGTVNPRAVPLVVTDPLGLGTVVYSALDPASGTLSTWHGLNSFWRLLAAQARSGSATTTAVMAGIQPSANQNSTLDQEIDNLSAPSFMLFVVLLGLYVLILVPLNFVILGRLKRRDLSWITLPAMVVVLVGITFGSAYVGRGQNVRTSVVSMLYLTSGSDRVMAQTYVGLFAPLAGDYTLNSDDPRQLGTALFSSNQNVSGNGGGLPLGLQTMQDNGQIVMPNIHMWSSRNAVLAGTTTYHGRLEGTLQVAANGHIRGALTNRTGAKLYGVVLASLGTYQTVGDIRPGQTVSVEMQSGASQPSSQSLSDFYNNGGSAQIIPANPNRPNVAQLGRQYPLASLNLGLLGSTTIRRMADGDVIPTNPDESAAERFQRILSQAPVNNSPLSFGSLVAIGWTAQPAVGFKVNGNRIARQDTDLLVQSIPYTLQTGSFKLNPGTIPVRLAGSDADLQQGGFQSGGGFTINSQTNAAFVGQLPLPTGGHTLHITSLTLSVYSGTGAGGMLTSDTAQLYDWQRGAWVPVDASNGDVSPKNPARFVNAAGVVRVRISAGDNSIGIADQNSGIALGATGDVR